MAGDYTYLIDRKAGTAEILMDGELVVRCAWNVMVIVGTSPRCRMMARARDGDGYCLALCVCADELMELGLVDAPR